MYRNKSLQCTRKQTKAEEEEEEDEEDEGSKASKQNNSFAFFSFWFQSFSQPNKIPPGGKKKTPQKTSK
jgi:hypothetical protein